MNAHSSSTFHFAVLLISLFRNLALALPLLAAVFQVGCQLPPKSSALDYVRTHKGTGAKKTLPVPQSIAYEALARQLADDDATLTKTENAIFAQSKKSDLAYGAYFYPIQPDKTDVELIITSRYLSADRLRKMESDVLSILSRDVSAWETKNRVRVSSRKMSPPALEPSRDMADPMRYLQTHKGTGSRQTFAVPLALAHAGIVYGMKKAGNIVTETEDGIFVTFPTQDLAFVAYLYPLQPDTTDVEVLVASPHLSVRALEDLEVTALASISKATEEALRTKGTQEERSRMTAKIMAGGTATTQSDIDVVPAWKTPTRKNAYAIVIGIEQYREKLPKADFADRDAKLVGEYLTKVMGYPEENVVVRTNEKASMNDLVKYLESWLPNNVEKNSPVFIYYSGHGAPNTKTGDAYLVPYDGDPTFVDKTGYPLKKLYAQLESLSARDITVVLDSCFSGAGGRSVIGKGLRPMGLSTEHSISTSGKTVVLAASSGDQVSSTYEEKGHGLLTYFFLKGLQGEGDLNKDGNIDMAELYEYVKPSVSKVARKKYNSEQTPQLLGSPDSLKRGGRLIERSTP
jgi:hypothetical protein